MIIIKIAVLLILESLLCLTNGDVFTAMVDLENLLTSEADVTSGVIEDYIAAEKTRLQRLEQFAQEHLSKNSESVQNNINYVTNPINAYLLIKRLSSDWKYITQLMKSNSAEYFIKNITQGRLDNSVKYPDDEDLEGAATALLRLQDTYSLQTKDLSKGIVAGDNVGKPLSAQDCFEVGRAAYNNKEYFHVVEWMEEALNKLKTEKPPTKKESDILEYYAYALYKQGNLKHALKQTRRLTAMLPNHPRATGNVKWYEDMLSEEERKNMDELPAIVNNRNLQYDITERTVYEKLCRGEFKENVTMDSKTYCYLKRDRPFLKLAPIKTEIVRFAPLVVIFHEVISDYEMEVVKNLAIPRLKRATVQNAKTGELETANYRISKSAWLKGYEHPVVNRINTRVDLMTNLNQATSEDLQVANYGLGGHYDPHFDHARLGNYVGGHYEPSFEMSANDETDSFVESQANQRKSPEIIIWKEETNAFKKLGTGNRVATVLFYMSQPEKGGATVYTDLETGVFPQLHNALFWYNLKRNGEGDVRTRHAACPVLIGIKWVSNKWIHERGQEFRRPCGLTPDVEEHFVGDLSPF